MPILPLCTVASTLTITGPVTSSRAAMFNGIIIAYDHCSVGVSTPRGSVPRTSEELHSVKLWTSNTAWILSPVGNGATTALLGIDVAPWPVREWNRKDFPCIFLAAFDCTP